MSNTSSSRYEPNIEQLCNETNFYSWKAAIVVRLTMLKLWDITSGATPRPRSPLFTEPTAEQVAWNISEIQARQFLCKHMEESLCKSMHPLITAPQIWQHIINRFSRPSDAALLRYFQSVLALRFTDLGNNSLAEYVLEFELVWRELVHRTNDAPEVAVVGNSLTTAVRVLALSEGSKAAILVASLPWSVWSPADYFFGGNSGQLNYEDVHWQLMQTHANRENEIVVDEQEEPESVGGEDCTWCRSRGFKSEGHVWQRCGRLRKSKREKRTRKGKGEGKGWTGRR